MNQPRTSARLGLYVRAIVFWIGHAFTTIVYAPIMVASNLLSLPWRFRLVLGWVRVTLALLEYVCGLRYRVEGKENLPDRPAIAFAKHQSTWETFAMNLVLPPSVWVVKRELLRVPFFGWGLAALQPIAIDRSTGKQAVKQLVEQGRNRLNSGLWVIVFPEGTRVLPGAKVRYKAGGAILAAETGAPVVPIAHNAGIFWPRHSFVKWPGEISVCIGPPIVSNGRSPEEINRLARTWIENKMEELSADSGSTR
jgi:1-acyl-sn-glycerol-3-phosphate acyltransferase